MTKTNNLKTKAKTQKTCSLNPRLSRCICLEVIITSLIRARVAIHIAHKRHCRVYAVRRVAWPIRWLTACGSRDEGAFPVWKSIRRRPVMPAGSRFVPRSRRRMPVSARGRCTCALFIGINGVQITRPSALLGSLAADLKTNLRTLISLMSSFTGRYRVAY